MRNLPFFLLISGISLQTAWATPEQCTAIRDDFSKRMDAWATTLKQTTDTEAQRQVWQQRPDAMTCAAKAWAILRPQLAQEWTLDHTGWLLKLVCSQPIDPKREDLIQLRSSIIEQTSTAIAEKHWNSSKLASSCFGLLAVGDQASLKILEKIESSNRNSRVQGVAAVCISHQLSNLSESPKIMKRRLTLLRKAIIESNEVTVDGVNISQLAKDQLYVIQNLCKGRQAPELMSVDQTGVTRKLSSHKGKVVILLFWAETMHDPEEFLELTRAMKAKYTPDKVEILGVFHGATEPLRKLHAEKFVTWTNLTDPDGALSKSYRVTTAPVAYVIDQQRTIQYIGSPGSFAELTADALLAPKQ